MNELEPTEEIPEEEPALDPRRCSVIRDDGSQCRGFKTSTGKCPGHSKLGLASSAEAAAEAAATSNGNRREQAEARKESRKRSYRDALADAWEQHADEIVAKRLEIIRNGNDADAERTIQAMENRIYGRSTEHVQTETVQIPADSAALERMSTEELDAYIAAELQRDSD